jgi:hypothetical protein
MTSFLKGLIAGAGLILALVLAVLGFRFLHNRDKKLFEQMEQQHAIQELREAMRNRDPLEFLEDPGVRGAADSGIEEFNRKRDEILQRRGSPGNRD